MQIVAIAWSLGSEKYISADYSRSAVKERLFFQRLRNLYVEKKMLWVIVMCHCWFSICNDVIGGRC